MRLVICEKPSVGLSIANVLGARTRHDGYMEGNGYTKIETWFGKVSDEGTSRFEKEGLITLKPLEKKVLFFHKTHSVRTASLSLKDEATKLLGLKKFLLNHTLTLKRNTTIWDL